MHVYQEIGFTLLLKCKNYTHPPTPCLIGTGGQCIGGAKLWEQDFFLKSVKSGPW